MGFWDEDTQQRILDAEVAVAGTGGTGNQFAMQLARLGVQRFRLADPEVFDRVNSNRVMGSRTDTIGRNKAEVLKGDILAINPEAEVTVYTEGITPDNIEDFLHASDVALNGTELTRPELGVMLARAARGRRISGKAVPLPIIDVEYIGHAGQGTVFHSASRNTYERVMGLRRFEHAPLDEIAEQTIPPSRYLAYLPPYGDLNTLIAIQNGAPLPSNMIGAGVAAQIGTAEVLKILRERAGKRGQRPAYGRVRWYDAYTNRSGRTRFPALSHYRHLSVVAARNLLRLHEPAGYSVDQRASRGDVDGQGASFEHASGGPAPAH